MVIQKNFSLVDWVGITSQFKNDALYPSLMKCSFCLFQNNVVVFALSDSDALKFEETFSRAINASLAKRKFHYVVKFVGPGTRLARTNWLYVALGVLAIVVLFLIALNFRYDVNRMLVFDRWRGDFL